MRFRFITVPNESLRGISMKCGNNDEEDDSLETAHLVHDAHTPSLRLGAKHISKPLDHGV